MEIVVTTTLSSARAFSSSGSPSPAPSSSIPRRLLADERTGALNSRTSVDIMGLFESLAPDPGIAVVIVNDRGIASRARRQSALRDGHLVVETPDLHLTEGA